MSCMNMNRPFYPRPGNGCGQWDCRDRYDKFDCSDRESWRMPLFDCDHWNSARDCRCTGQTVRLENPCCPGEFAEVNLSVDPCGNLVIYVHKNACACYKPKKRC